MKDKIILIAILIIFNTSVSGQVIKCDSIIELHGQYAKLRGKDISNDNVYYFVWQWRGGFKAPPLIGCTFTFVPEGKKIRRKTIYIAKNK